MNSEFFKEKKVTLMGLGLLGRGVGDAEFLAQSGAEVIVTDLKTEAELQESVDRLKVFPNVTLRLGGHALEDFTSRDFVLKAAGVPEDSLYIAEARSNGIPIKMSASWFAELAAINVVGVTGTRGKTTVTYMLKDIMEKAGMRVLLGGNVRGVSTLALLSEVKAGSVALMELDSWQLQGFGEALMSPNVAVFTTFYDDHLNYYKNNRVRYLKDKAQIFLNQKPGDVFVLGDQAEDTVLSAYTPPVEPAIVGAPTIAGWELSVPGEHNRYNAALAATAAKALGIDEQTCKDALKAFHAVPGRLEPLGAIGGVSVYNDTTATTPEATIAALRALSTAERKNIILIMGGADKGLAMNALWPEVLARCKDVYFLSGTGTDRIRLDAPLVPEYASLDEALTAALSGAEAGDVLLFSPAFASFGMFKNEYDRGDQFTALVRRRMVE